MTVKGSTGAMLAVLLTGQAMASMDGSIVSVAAQTIRAELGAGGAVVQLIVSGYLLTTGVLLVTCARLGDVFGHRRMFLAGLAWFTVASLLCGLAPTAALLVGARVLQAVGAAMLLPQVFSLIQLLWQGEARRRAIGLYGMVLALGVALGQIVGGLVVTGLGWRPAFLVNVPIGAVLLVLGTRVLRKAPSGVRPRLDVAGVAVLTLAMVGIVTALVFGPEYGWPGWAWGALAGGGCLMAAFLDWERRLGTRGRQPLLDLKALRPRGVKPGLAACWIVMGCYTGFLLTLTLHLQASLEMSPLAAGVAFVPYALGFAVLSLTWTRWPAWTHRALPVAGPLAFAVAGGAVVLLSRTTWTTAMSAPLLMVAGAGHAAGYSPLIARIAALVEPRLASAISALNSTGPLLAGVTSVAGLGSVYFGAPTSADGLGRVMAVLAGLLVVAAGCAWLVTMRRARAEALN